NWSWFLMFCTLKPGGRMSSLNTRSTTFALPSLLTSSDLRMLSGETSCIRSGWDIASQTLSTGALILEVKFTFQVSPSLPMLSVGTALTGPSSVRVQPPQPAKPTASARAARERAFMGALLADGGRDAQGPALSAQCRTARAAPSARCAACPATGGSDSRAP